MSRALLFLALATALGAQATRWKQIGTTTTGNPVFVDPRSVSSNDGIITAKVRVTFAEPVKMPSGLVTATHTTAMFDCPNKKVAVKESIFFADEAKGVVAERRAPKQPGFGPVFRSNFSGVALDHLCAPPAPPAARPAPPKRPPPA